MIKINLALKKQTTVTAAKEGRGGATNLLGNIRLDQIKELPLRRILIPVVVGYVASLSLDGYKEDRLNEVEQALAKQKAEESKTQAELSKVKSYESLKNNLDGDELLIKTKLDVVKKLMDNRGSIVRSLFSLASVTPRDIWLTSFKCDPTSVSLQGSSLGFNPISDFMKNLNESKFFAGIELVNSQQMAKEGSETVSFELKGTRK